jgi:hypothetical protein
MTSYLELATRALAGFALENPAAGSRTGGVPTCWPDGAENPPTLQEMAPYLEPAEFVKLSAPAVRPDRCPWCRGIWRHSRPCEELQRDWLTPFPWGRRKGKPLSDVPADYLRWALAKPDLMTELRRDIERELKFRQREQPAPTGS